MAEQPRQLDHLGVLRRVDQPGRTRQVAVEIASLLAARESFTAPDSAAEEIDDRLLMKAEADAVIGKAVDMFRGRVAAESYWKAPDRDSRALVPFFDALLARCSNWVQARMAFCDGLLEGRAALRIIGDVVHMRAPGDTVSRPWWVPRWLVPIGKPQLELRWEEREYHDTRSGKSYKRPVSYWSTFDLFANQWYRIEAEQLDTYCILTWGTSWDTAGGGRGILHSMAKYLRDFDNLRETMVRGTLRFAFPFMIVQLADSLAWGTDTGDGEDLESPGQIARKIATALKRMASGQVLVMSESDKVTPVDFNGDGGNAMLGIVNWHAEALVARLLAATMPTGGGEAAGGRAHASVEQGSTDDFIRPKRAAMEDALASLPRQMWQRNMENWQALGLADLRPPELKLGQERVDNPADAEMRLRAAAELGLPVANDHAYELLQLDPPSPEQLAAGDVIGLPAPPPMPGEVDPMIDEGMDDAGIADPRI